MTAIVVLGVACSLVLFAIILKARAAKPKKAEKWEKAQIMKQLLALSENEDMLNRSSRQASAPPRQAPRHRAAAVAAGGSRSRTARSA